MNPRFAELAHCAGLPSAASAEVRLQKLLKAAIDGEDALDVLLEADAADGQDELRAHAGKPPHHRGRDPEQRQG